MKIISTRTNLLILAFLSMSFAAFAQPATQASDIIIEPIPTSTTSLKFNWTNGDGGNRIVLIKSGNGVYTPVNAAASPAANADFGAGTDLDAGAGVVKCVYNASGATATVTVTNLAAGTLYTIQIYEYSGTSGSPTYNFNNSSANPLNVIYYTATGTTTSTTPVTIPANLYGVTVQAFGGGGGGGGSNGSSSTDRAGSGGAGGSYTKGVASVTPGASVNVIVGGGGPGGTGSDSGDTNGTKGGDTSFGSVTATGGNGGLTGVSADATGNRITGPSGTFNGGDGAECLPISTTSSAATASGGGGGSAGISGAGGHGGTAGGGSGTTAGIGGSGGGGNGAAGVTATNDGVTATQMGGGGSGSISISNTDHTGGAGAPGRIILSYSIPTVISATLDYNTGSLVVKLSDPVTLGNVTGSFFHINNAAGTNVVDLTNAEAVSVNTVNKTVTFTLTESHRLAALAISGVTGGDGGAVVLDVLAGGIKNSEGNPNIDDLGNAVTETGDTTPPTVVSVSSSTADGYYNAGDVIAVTVTFSETVTVTNNPLITLETGATDRDATYASGSGSTVLTFNYTVQAGDASSDLDYVGTTALSLNTTGIIKDAANNNATLTLANPGTSGSIAFGKAIVVDTQAPSGYTVAIDQTFINNANKSAVSFTFAGAEVGATYNYSIDDTDGATTAVTGTGTISSATQQITGINVTSLTDGTLTLTVYLTDLATNQGANATSAKTKDVVAPSGYTVAIDQASVKQSNQNALSFTFAGATAGDTFNWSIDDTNGGTTAITGSGTIVTATDQITGINVSSLSDGTLTLSVTLTDAASNTGTAATATVSKDATAPSGYSVSIDQTLINSGNKTSVSFTFASAEVGATYHYSFDDTDGATTAVTGTNTVTSATQQVTGIDLSGLTDGTITLTVYLVDTEGNQGSNATNNKTKDATAPVIVSVTSNASGAVPLKIGDQIVFTVDIQTTEAGLTISPTTYNGGTLSWSTSDLGSTYTATYTVTSGQSDQTSALQLVNVNAKDANNNTSANVSGTDVTNTIDANNPGAVTTGTITTIGAPVVTNYWNGSNTSLTVDVQVPADVVGQFSLVGGTIKIQGRKASDAFADIAGATATIAAADIGSTRTLTLTKAQFESISGFNDGLVAQLRAVITDVAGNSTTGSNSANVNIDRIAPTTQTVGTVTGRNGREVAGYWNSHNTQLEVIVPLDNADASLDNGSIQLQLQNTQTTTWVDITTSGLVTISNTDRTGSSKTIQVAEGDFEGNASFISGLSGGLASAETRFVQVRAIVKDIAGNSKTFTQSTTNLDVDITPPAINGSINLYSDAGLGGGDGNHEVIQFELNEDITLSDGTNVLSTNTNGNSGFYVAGNLKTADSKYESDGSPNVDASYAGKRAIYLESSANASGWAVGTTALVYTRQASFPGSGNFVRDAAGNEMANTNQTVNGTGTTTTIATATSGVAASPINNSTTNAVVFAFSLTSSTSLNLTSLSIATTANPSQLLKNFRLYAFSGSDNFSSATDLSLTATVSASAVAFNSISIPLSSTPQYFYLVCDVENYFYSASPAIQFSLASTGITVSTGGRSGSVTGTNYTLQDTTAPVATITNVEPVISLTLPSGNALQQTVKIQFNEPMNGATSATAGKIIISGTTFGAFSGGTWSTTTLTNDTYTVTFTHNGSSQNGTAASRIFTASGLTDFGGNSHATVTSSTFIVDTQRPTATTTTNLTAVTLTNKTIRVSVKYGETMSTSSAPTMGFSYGTFGSGTPVTGAGYTNGWKTTTFTNDTYEIDFTNNTTNEYNASVTVSANGAIDAHGNTQTSSATSPPFVVDTQRPTVLSIKRNTPTPTNSSTVYFDVKFSEAIALAQLDPADFSNVIASTVSGTPNAGTVNATGFNTSDGGVTYTVQVDGVQGDAFIRLDIKATATIQDASGNALNVGYNSGETLEIDQTAPKLAAVDGIKITAATAAWAASVNGTSASTLTWDVTFDGPVNNVQASDFSFTDPNGDITYTVPVDFLSGSGANYTIKITNVQISGFNEQIKLDLTDFNSITDDAGNFLGGPVAGDGNSNTSFTAPSNEYYTILRAEPTDAATTFSITGETTSNISFTFKEPTPTTTPANYYFVQVKKNTITSFPTISDGTYPYDTDFSDGQIAFIVANSGGTIGVDIHNHLQSFYGANVNLSSGFDYDIRVTATNYSGNVGSLWLLDYLTSAVLDGANENTTTDSKTTFSGSRLVTSVQSTSNAAPGTAVYQFTIDEDGLFDNNDDSPTKFNAVVFTKGSTNNIADWRDAIAGAELIDENGKTASATGTVSIHANDISFSGFASNDQENPNGSGKPELGFVKDNTTKTYTLKIWLKNPLAVADNALLDFKLTELSFSPDNAIDIDKFSWVSSGIAAHTEESGSIKVDVHASQLVFVVEPPLNIGVGTKFSQAVPANLPELHALDAYGNLDTDYNASISISPAAGIVNTNTTFSGGILKLSNFYFSTQGSRTLTISGNATSTAPVYAAIVGGNAAVSAQPVNAVISNKTTISEGILPAAENATIESTDNSVPSYVNFDFVVSDDVGANTSDYSDNDALPTIIRKITIGQGSNNGDNGGGTDATTFDKWLNSLGVNNAQLEVIGSTETVNGTVTDNTIYFNIPVGSALETVPDGGALTYRLKIWLRNSLDASLLDIIEGKDFSFVVNNGLIDISTTANVSSSFTSSSASTADGTNAVNVDASHFVFETQWATDAAQSYDAPLDADVAVGLQNPVARARDANGNLDTNYSGSVSVSVVDPNLADSKTYPLSNSTVTVNANGFINFHPDLAVSSSGNGAHGDTGLKLSLTDGTISGTSETFTLYYSDDSDVIRETTFAYPTNILYATPSYRIDDITPTTGLAMERFKVRDGGGANDDDGTATKVNSVTVRVKNYNRLKQIALYEVGPSPGFALNNELDEVTVTSITATNVDVVNNTADFVFNTGSAFSAPDGSENNFVVKVSFNDSGIIDNEVFTFEVVGISQQGVSSAFTDPTPTGIVSSSAIGTAGNTSNRIEVVATEIDYTTVPAQASLYSAITIVVQARDSLQSVDLDYNGTITATGNTAGYTTANDPTGVFVNGVLTYPLDDVATVGVNEGFYFTSGTTFTKLTISAGAGSAAGSVNAAAINGTSPVPGVEVMTSYDSWIYFDANFTYTDKIDFVTPANQNTATSSTSLALARLVLSDGGATAGSKTAASHVDIDKAFTQIASVTISLTHPEDIRAIGLYTSGGVQIGTDQTPGATVTFTGTMSAADDATSLYYVRATFKDIITQDLDQVNMQITNVVWSAGSQFPATAGTVGGVDGTGTGGDSSAPGHNYIDVIATTLDFTTQPSTFAGKQQPIDGTTNGYTGVVKARDKFANLDLDFNESYTVTADAGVDRTLLPTKFTNGVLDLAGLKYNNAGDGTIEIISNTTNLNSTNGLVPCSHVDVIHVTADLIAGGTGGVIETTNIKGGTLGSVIFGVTFRPEHSSTGEPMLKGFTITFSNPYKTSTETVLNKFNIYESTDGVFNQGNDITLPQFGQATISEAHIDTTGISLDGYNALIVTFATPRPLYQNYYSYFLSADVDPTANISTPHIRPQLFDFGYSDSYSNDFVSTDVGSSTAAVWGAEYQFASTRPPKLVATSPYNGQLNVDPALHEIELKFDVGVLSFDSVAELYQRSTNQLVATLHARNGKFNGKADLASQVVDTIRFAIPNTVTLYPDTIYYLKIAKGSYDAISNTGTGISDEAKNFYGGISYNGTLYFKISSPNAPDMMSTDKSKYFASNSAAIFNATFDQFGTGYYLILKQNATNPAPTNSQIADPTTYPLYSTMYVAHGSFDITQVSPNLQNIAFTADLVPGAKYDVWIYSENNANPAHIATTAPYGAAPNFIPGAAGPTLTITVPNIISNSNKPIVRICPNSSVLIPDPIIIGETNANDFNSAGVQDFNLLLPTGFSFNVDRAPIVTLSGSDFSTLGDTAIFVNNTILNISFTNNNTASLDNIIISNLEIYATTAGAIRPITRFAGNGLYTVDDGDTLATLYASPLALQKFTNTYTENNDFSTVGLSNVVVNAIPDNYNSSTSEVRLIPKITPSTDYGASFFSGPGVTDDVLNLTGVALDASFDIVMTHTDLNGCVTDKTEQYLVYDHTKAIPSLNTKDSLRNENFPLADAGSWLPNSKTLNYNDKAGYNLVELYATIPTRIDSGAQIIYGADWEDVIEQIPFVVDTAESSKNTSVLYRSYKLEYAKVLNAVTVSSSKISINPYNHDIFADTTQAGQPYWRGGSLGVIEFIGKYRSSADLTVYVPFRQEVELFIPPIPVIETSGQYSSRGTTAIFCQNQAADIILNGFPLATAGVSVGSFVLRDSLGFTSTNPVTRDTSTIYDAAKGIKPIGFKDNSNGTANLTPHLLANHYRTIRVEYTYQDNNSPASGTAVFYIRITPNPDADFTVANPQCEGVDVQFTDKSDDKGAGIATWAWNFSDPESATNGSNLQNPIHLYAKAGLYPDVSLGVTSKFGCPSVQVKKQSVTIGATPVVKVKYSGVSVNDSIVFDLSASSTSFDALQQFHVAFGDTHSYTGGNLIVKHGYASPGIDTVSITYTSQKQCVANKIITIGVVPYKPVAEDENSTERFDTNGEWQTLPIGTVPSSWGYNASTKNWSTGVATGSYNANESSALYSPVFDLEELSRPIITFDDSLSLGGEDGVVLEYSVDSLNIADPQKQWLTVVVPGSENGSSGVKWYNGQNLSTKPGAQTNNFFGWVGAGDWVHSKHTLSDVPDANGNPRSLAKNKRVIFRFALSSKRDDNDQGFALDNFRIGNGTRTVLVENFTNTSSTSVAEQNTAFRKFLEDQQLVGVEAVKIQYHTSFPGSDPFNQENQSDPGARALFYNISTVPQARLDGGDGNFEGSPGPDFSDWGLYKFNRRVLDLANAVIEPQVQVTGQTVRVSGTFKPLDNLEGSTLLYVAIIEKQVTRDLNTDIFDGGRVGSGEDTLSYILRKLLPSASGQRFMNLTAGVDQEFDVSWDVPKLYAPEQDLKVVIFLQGEDNKIVYQSRMVDSDDPELVTGVDPSKEYTFNVYPSPADDQLTIELPHAVKEITNMQVYDQLGKLMFNSTFKKGESKKTISTVDYSGGVYLIQVECTEGPLRRKVMVLHRN